jgi:hypothetical protein
MPPIFQGKLLLGRGVGRACASKFLETTPYFKKYGREIHPTKSAIP